MSFNYRQGILRTQNVDFPSIKQRLNNEQTLVLLNAALGLGGEAGEVVDIVKKAVMHGKELDYNKLINELGDVRYYLELAAMALNVPMKEIERLNIEKLDKRYPNGFTLADSLAKKDETQ